MGVIKINNIIYGSNNASDIIYKDITVEEKLDTIPIFDINDNGAVVVESDVLTYGHIVDNLNSTESNKILSAKQGKILSEKIDNIDLSYLEEDILAVENKIDNFQVAKKITQAAYDALPEEEKNNGIYVIEDDEGNIFVARNIEYDGSKTGLGATVQQAIDNIATPQFKEYIINSTDFSHVRSGTSSYYVEIGDFVFVSIYLVNNIAITAGTSYKIPTNLPLPNTYHASAGYYYTKNVPASITILLDGQLSIKAYGAVAASGELIGQLFYRKLKE